MTDIIEALLETLADELRGLLPLYDVDFNPHNGRCVEHLSLKKKVHSYTSNCYFKLFCQDGQIQLEQIIDGGYYDDPWYLRVWSLADPNFSANMIVATITNHYIQ